MEELPALPKARRAHACASLPAQVTMITWLLGSINIHHLGAQYCYHHPLHPPLVKGFVVAGGSYDGSAEDFTSSVATRVFPCVSNK